MRLKLVGLLCLFVGYGAGCERGSDRAYEALLQGNAAFNAQAYDSALVYYNRSLEWDAANAEAYLRRGQIRWLSSQHDRAVQDFNRALELSPTLYEAYQYRGISLLNLQRFEEGIADLTEAITSETLMPEMLVKALHFRGAGYMNLARYEEAIADVSRCIDLEPEHPIYHFERAALNAYIGQTDAAIADYEAFLALAPPEAKTTEEARQKLAVLRQNASQ